MSLRKLFLVIITASVFISCKDDKENTVNKTITTTQDTIVTKKLSKSQKIIAETIAAHGGTLYNTAHFSFVFRGNTYHFKNNGNNFEYKKMLYSCVL